LIEVGHQNDAPTFSSDHQEKRLLALSNSLATKISLKEQLVYEDKVER
jgi:hypothetical protein